MSKRKDIIAAIKFGLQSVTTENGYLTDVRRVEHRAAVSSEIAPGIRPWIGFRIGPEKLEWRSFRESETVAKLVVIGVLPEKGTEDDASDAADDFITDIIGLFMRADPGLMGAGDEQLVTQITPVSIDTDCSDNTNVGDQVEIEFEVLYHVTW